VHIPWTDRHRSTPDASAVCGEKLAAATCADMPRLHTCNCVSMVGFDAKHSRGVDSSVVAHAAVLFCRESSSLGSLRASGEQS